MGENSNVEALVAAGRAALSRIRHESASHSKAHLKMTVELLKNPIPRIWYSVPTVDSTNPRKFIFSPRIAMDINKVVSVPVLSAAGTPTTRTQSSPSLP
jgi:hypothetical protein